MTNSNKLFNVMHFHYKYLVYFVMLFITLKLSITMLVYQTINLFGFTASLSIILMPILFFMLDIITEIYTYQVTKKIIIWALICQFIFTLILYLTTHITSLNNEASQTFNVMPRIAIASLFGMLSGGILNAHILEKYRIIFKGKYFILRALGSTIIGELIYTIVTDTVAFIWIKPFFIIMQLIITSFIVKLVFNPFMIIPTIYLSKILKKAENN